MGAPSDPAVPAPLADALRLASPVCVAFSGGVDSSTLVAAAADVLGAGQVVAVTASSSMYLAEELAAAGELARRLGVHHVVVDVDVLRDERVAANDPDRCYHCKALILGRLQVVAAERGCGALVDGVNRDDLCDHRPGLRAAEERGVRHPLVEAGMGKTEGRALARELGLDVWDRPANACLATRIPYGEPLTHGRLSTVAAAEAVLRRLGLVECRVRHHGAVARIEVPAAELETVLAMREAIVAGIRDAGFTYVTLDLAGLRSGSMNDVLDEHGEVD